MYSTDTTEVHRPSLSKQSKKQKISFVVSIQHVRNVNMVVQCEECEIWRLIKKNLTVEAKKGLERKLSSFDFSCGASTTDLDLSDELEMYTSGTLDVRTLLRSCIIQWGMNKYAFNHLQLYHGISNDLNLI